MEPHAATVLDAISVPVILLEPDRRVILANAAAVKVLDGRFGLTLQSNRIVVTDSGLQNPFQSAVDEVLRYGEAHKPAITLPQDPAGRRAVLHLALANSDDAKPEVAPTPTLIAVISCARDLEGHELLRLRKAFGLSEVEAEIAALIVSGHSPRAIARTRKITEQTVRWHIKNIHSKTHTKRLPDLVLQIQATRSPF